MSIEHWWNDTDRKFYWEKNRGNWSSCRRTCPTATLSTTDLTCTGLGSNLFLQIHRLATNHLTHSTDKIFGYYDDLKNKQFTRSVPKVMRMIFFFLIYWTYMQLQFIPFKAGSLQLNTVIPALLPLFIAVEEVFTWDVVQSPHRSRLNVFQLSQNYVLWGGFWAWGIRRNRTELSQGHTHTHTHTLYFSSLCCPIVRPDMFILLHKGK